MKTISNNTIHNTVAPSQVVKPRSLPIGNGTILMFCLLGIYLLIKFKRRFFSSMD